MPLWLKENASELWSTTVGDTRRRLNSWGRGGCLSFVLCCCEKKPGQKRHEGEGFILLTKPGYSSPSWQRSQGSNSKQLVLDIQGQEQRDMDAGDWGIITGVETIGIWARYVTSGSAGAQSCLYHFLWMKDCWSARPTSWLGGLDNTQFMMGSSGCTVTWWPIFKCSVPTKAQ